MKIEFDVPDVWIDEHNNLYVIEGRSTPEQIYPDRINKGNAALEEWSYEERLTLDIVKSEGKEIWVYPYALIEETKFSESVVSETPVDSWVKVWTLDLEDVEWP